MAKTLLILVTCILLISCNKSRDKIASEKSYSDSLSYYMIYANNKKNNIDKKIIALDKSYLLIDKVENNQKNRDTLFGLMLSYYNLKFWEKFNKASKKLLLNSEITKDSIDISKCEALKCRRMCID